jgi:FKBP-type peptidyl-prolyl cis-trans isomerase (trigger factor)
MRKVDASNKLYYDAQFDAGTFDLTLGANGAIKGFEEGVSRMKVGEKAILVFLQTLDTQVVVVSTKLLVYM